MVLRQNLRQVPSLMLLAWATIAATQASAVTQFQKRKSPFIFDISTLNTTIALPVSEEVETVKMQEQQILTRLDKSPTNKIIEPLTILMSDNEQQLAAVVERIAHLDKQDELLAYFKKSLRKAKPVKEGSNTKTVIINDEAIALIDIDAFADMYAKQHHKLVIDTTSLKKNRTLRREFMHQIAPFFKKSERRALHNKINKGEPIPVDEELLPEFARKMVRKFIVYRGPNCFHAALAFHSPVMTSSSLINVKKETGYHRAMINYDELWRAINRNFYEVNLDQLPLKYGDMVVFFEVPENVKSEADKPVDFRWIRHTATYLFNGYTFSKGSKSPNTPYTVRTLADEWKTWQKYTKNLGVKVFRRSQKSVKTQPPMDLVDWMY